MGLVTVLSSGNKSVNVLSVEQLSSSKKSALAICIKLWTQYGVQHTKKAATIDITIFITFRFWLCHRMLSPGPGVLKELIIL